MYSLNLSLLSIFLLIVSKVGNIDAVVSFDFAPGDCRACRNYALNNGLLDDSTLFRPQMVRNDVVDQCSEMHLSCGGGGNIYQVVKFFGGAIYSSRDEAKTVLICGTDQMWHLREDKYGPIAADIYCSPTEVKGTIFWSESIAAAPVEDMVPMKAENSMEFHDAEAPEDIDIITSDKRFINNKNLQVCAQQLTTNKKLSSSSNVQFTAGNASFVYRQYHTGCTAAILTCNRNRDIHSSTKLAVVDVDDAFGVRVGHVEAINEVKFISFMCCDNVNIGWFIEEPITAIIDINTITCVLKDL